MIDEQHLEKLLQPALNEIINHTHSISNPTITGWILVTRAESLTDSESEYNIYTCSNNGTPESIGLIEIGKTILINAED